MGTELEGSGTWRDVQRQEIETHAPSPPFPSLSLPMQLASALNEWRVSADPKTAAMRAQRERLPAHKLSASVVETCARAQVSGEGGS